MKLTEECLFCISAKIAIEFYVQQEQLCYQNIRLFMPKTGCKAMLNHSSIQSKSLSFHVCVNFNELQVEFDLATGHRTSLLSSTKKQKNTHSCLSSLFVTQRCEAVQKNKSRQKLYKRQESSRARRIRTEERARPEQHDRL